MTDHRLQIVLAAKDVTGKAFTTLKGKMAALTKSVFSLQGGLVALAGAYGLKMAATAALDVAASFEQMQVKLDALTKGKGAETLDKINAWALEMPVNTRKAVDTFAMMQAMGLDPTIEKMQTLVDTSSIFGEETMPRVARALGQMATLGKLSAEELNQMSEAGINARKYLTEAFGMTVQELQKSQVSIEEIIDAIWQGLDADFGGAAKKAQDSWQGMVLTFKSYMEEILKQIMDAGVFELIKSHLEDVNKGLKEWIENNDALIRQKVPEYLNAIGTGIRFVGDVLSVIIQTGRNLDDVLGISEAYRSIQNFKKAFAEIGAVLSGEKNWNTGLPAGTADRISEEFDRAHEAYVTVISDTDQLGVSNTRLAESITRVKEATMAETEAMAAMYQRQFDVTVDSYTQGFVDMARAEEEAAREMAKFQQQVDEMNGIMSNISTWDLMQDQLNKTADAAKRTGDMVGNNLGNALNDIITGAKEAKEAFADFAKSTINWMMQMMMKQTMSSLFGSFNFGTAAAAQGAVFDQSGMVPFARGGVVNRPTIFPFASGIGLMGEAGPEAILPLTRTSGGDLGVKTEGGGGGTTIFINAVDSKSFDDMIRRNPGSIVKVVGDAMTSNASLRSTMRKTM